MACFFIIGVVTAWSGFNYPIIYYNMDVMDFQPYHVAKLVLSFCLLVMGMILLKGPHITIGILSILTGISTFTYSFTEVAFNMNGDPLLDFVLCFPIMLIAVFNLINHKRFRAVTIGIQGLSMLITCTITNSDLVLIGGVGFMISGLMFMFLGITGLVKNTESEEKEDRDHGFEMMAIAGFLLMAIYAILSSVEDYDNGYYVVSLTISTIITIISIRCLLDGIVIEGVMQFMFGFSGIIFAIGRAFGGEGYVITDLGIATVIGFCGLMMLLRKQYVLAIGALLFSAMVIPGMIFEQGFSWAFGSSMMAPFLIYYSISRWIYLESKREILPLWE